MSDSWLSSGIILRLLTASSNELDDIYASAPTLQILSVKKIHSNQLNLNSNNGDELGNGNSVDVFRILISDGKWVTQCKLSTELNHLVHGKKILKNTVVTVNKWTLKWVSGKKLIIIEDVHILCQTEKKIGKPESIDVGLLRVMNSASSSLAVASVPSPVQSNTPSPAASGSSMSASVSHWAAAQAQSPVLSLTPSAAPARALVTSTTLDSQRQNHQSLQDTSHTVCLIKDLNIYKQNWPIKTRVTYKSSIRNYLNQNGPGKYFNCTFTDESGTIRGVAFNDAVDIFYAKMHEGHNYYVSKAQVVVAKNAKNGFEIVMNTNTEIKECLEEVEIPVITPDFKPLDQLQALAKDSTCDVIGVVTWTGPVLEGISKSTGQKYVRRELTIVDQTLVPVPVTFWNKDAEQYNAPDYPVIIFKDVKIVDFRGRSLSMTNSSSMIINPDFPEAHTLRTWYDATNSGNKLEPKAGGVSPSFAGPSSSSSNSRGAMTIAEVKETQLGHSEQLDLFSAKATILEVKNSKSITYPGCPKCSKKVTQIHEGWKCEKCDTIFKRPEYRYNLQISVADYSKKALFSGFNEVGLQVFGMTANELVELKDRDEAEYEALLHNASCKTYNFTCVANQVTWNDLTRTRYGIQKMSPLDYRAEAKSLRDQLLAGRATRK